MTLPTRISAIMAKFPNTAGFVNIILLIFLPVFLVFGLGGVVSAATYTVCAAACDYTTIQGAFDGLDLAPGDTVEVRADTPFAGGTKYYNETVTPGANDAGDASQQVTLKARTGDTIYIDCQDARDNAIALNNVSYFTIDGFYIDNCNQYSAKLNGVSASNRITGVIVQNLHINIANNAAIANSHEGIYLLYGQDVVIQNNIMTTDLMSVDYQTDGIYIQSSNATIIDGNQCTIRTTGIEHNDCVQVYGPAGQGSGITIKNNILIHDNLTTSNRQHIYIEALNGDVTVYNNVLYSTGATGSNCLSIAPKAPGVAGVTKIYNNTIYLNGSAAAGIKMDSYVNNPYVKNNVCHINSSTGYCMDLRSATLTPAFVDNNISFKTSGDINWAGAFSLTWTEWQAAGFDANGLNANPQLALSPPEVLLHLMPASPAINAGAVLPDFTTDRDGNPRGAILWDMGAYETDTLAPAAPVLISVQ